MISRLRWGCATQRPQPLMTRLARRFRVLYVEAPVPCDGAPRLETSQAAPGVERLVPHTPIDGVPGFHARQLPTLATLLQRHLREQRIGDALLWLDTPLASGLVRALRPRLLVYDVIDEPATQGAPREATPMSDADLVLAASPALYEAQRGRHANVHCLPSADEWDDAARRVLRLIDTALEPFEEERAALVAGTRSLVH